MTLRVAVVGTDTGVGKTHAAVAFRDHLAGRGLRVAAVKPYVTGAIKGRWPDCDALDPSGAWPSPARFRLPLSPWGAVRRGEPAVDVAAVRAYLRRAESEADAVVVEGIGGVMVPLDRDRLWIDLHAEFGWPALIVARGGLGTLNHTLLTIEALRKRSIPIVAFVLSAASPAETVTDDERRNTPRAASEENARILEELTGVECLGSVDYDPEAIGAAWARGADWARLEGRLG